MAAQLNSNQNEQIQNGGLLDECGNCRSCYLIASINLSA